MYLRLTCKSSILTLPLFITYLLILLLVATSSFQQLCLMVGENNLKAFFFPEDSHYIQQLKTDTWQTWMEGGMGGRQGWRKEGRKKEKEKRKREEGEEWKERK